MNVKNSLSKTQDKTPTFSSFITSEGVKRKINNMVGGKDGQRFITSIISAVSTNPTLAECDQGTILSAAMLGEALKLSPSPQLGQYYMVPYNQKEKRDRNGTITQVAKKVATFQLGYKGYIQLAVRSGYYKKINVLSIKEGELIRFDPLNEEIEVNLIEDELEREEMPTIGYYAMFEYQNGFKKAIYWSKRKMEAHADRYSSAFSMTIHEKIEAGTIAQNEMWKYSSFWYKDFDGMAYKTMLRQLISKWGIMSIDLQSAIEKDMAAIDESGKFDYVDRMEEVTPQPEETIIENTQITIESDDDFFSEVSNE